MPLGLSSFCCERVHLLHGQVAIRNMLLSGVGPSQTATTQKPQLGFGAVTPYSKNTYHNTSLCAIPLHVHAHV